eukprot:scaffold8008_cov34-Tisochrysis_lutea.AAC.8
MGGEFLASWPTLGLAMGGWREGLECVAMAAMEAVLVWGLQVVARRRGSCSPGAPAFGVARARFGGATLVAARSAGAAGVAAGEEGSGTRSMTLSVY